MALKWFKLPVCDLCKEPWFPQPGPARQDPRGFEASQKGKGKPGMRCGKCKRKDWDRDNKQEPERPEEVRTVEVQLDCDLHFENPRSSFVVKGLPLPQVTAADVEQTIDRPTVKMIQKRCIHGLFTCPQCGQGE